MRGHSANAVLTSAWTTTRRSCYVMFSFHPKFFLVFLFLFSFLLGKRYLTSTAQLEWSSPAVKYSTSKYINWNLCWRTTTFFFLRYPLLHHARSSYTMDKCAKVNYVKATMVSPLKCTIFLCCSSLLMLS